MATQSPSIEKTGAWYGFLDGICLIAYAFILNAANLNDVPALRFGFIIISLIFICMAIAALRRGKGGQIKYLEGIGVGAVTAIISTLMLAFFTIIAIQFLDWHIVQVLEDENILGQHVTLSSVFMVITMIGIVGGTLAAFIAMQYYKRPLKKI